MNGVAVVRRIAKYYHITYWQLFHSVSSRDHWVYRRTAQFPFIIDTTYNRHPLLRLCVSVVSTATTATACPSQEQWPPWYDHRRSNLSLIQEWNGLRIWKRPGIKILSRSDRRTIRITKGPLETLRGNPSYEFHQDFWSKPVGEFDWIRICDISYRSLYITHETRDWTQPRYRTHSNRITVASTYKLRCLTPTNHQWYFNGQFLLHIVHS